MRGTVIILNGASSSGKSTIAKELQKQLQERFHLSLFTISIDDFLKMSKDEAIYEDDVFDIMPMLCAKVDEKLNNSDIIVIDHVITSERIYRMLMESLSDCIVYKILVVCPPKILCERELARGNRCIGSSLSSLEYLYPKDDYDLTIDTSVLVPSACVKNIFTLCNIQQYSNKKV